MPKITGFRDVEDLKYRIATDPTVQYNLAMFAHMLGFGWCGGTQYGKVGEGFDVSKQGDIYLLGAHYDPNDPFAGGYWADKRLSIGLSAFRVVFRPHDIQFSDPMIANLAPLAVHSFMAENKHDHEEPQHLEFSYQLTESVSNSTSFQFGGSITLKEGVTVEIPFFGKGQAGVEIGFSVEEGWTDTHTTTSSQTTTDSYTATVPPHSQRLIEMIAVRTQSDVDYTASVSIQFSVTYHGFLRWDGNARLDHTVDRPFVTVTFGALDGSKSAAEEIMDQYKHADIPGYSDWDWNWMKKNFGGTVEDVVTAIGPNFVTADIPGKFTDVKGMRCEIRAHDPVPLPPVSAIGSTIPNAARHDRLRSDESPGVRVL